MPLPPAVAEKLAELHGVSVDDVEGVVMAGAQTARDTIAAGLAAMDEPTTAVPPPPVELEP